jgi:uncharacterized protein (DUF4415 family)
MMQRTQGEFDNNVGGGVYDAFSEGPDMVDAKVNADGRVEVVVELDTDVIEKIKALGPDWQTRVNEILKAAKL